MLKTPHLKAALLSLVIIPLSLPCLAVPDQTLEEIIVTANFRDSTLKNTIGSVSILPQSTITERAAQHLQDILNAVPNVTWAGGASRGRFVQIRGVGDLDQHVCWAGFWFRDVGEDQSSLGARLDERLHAGAPITPSSVPTSTNAATARSMSSTECAAFICVRIRAVSCGTTGKEKPIT